ncbi:MAG TPA: hypothetical protein VJR23_09820 [Candidatus Acidoferrales bacterium]|nr:hypothetical protein [Candidatus Acidoferrales bacterium]
MAQSILIFDFGANEEAAQQARHKLEGWKQAFRLGNKVSLKFDREDAESPQGESAAAKPEGEEAPKAPGAKSKGTAAKKKAAGSASDGSEKSEKKDESPTPARIHLLVRLDFSDHEKLTHHRWLDRIPAEDPFKSAKPEVIRHSDAAFAKAAERFESLD